MPVIYAKHPCQSSMPVIHASHATHPCKSWTPHPPVSSLYLQLSITAISFHNATLLSCHFRKIATVSHFRLVWCLNQTEGHLYFFIHFIICTLDWMEEIWQMNCDKRQQQMISTGAGVNTWLAAACRRCQVLPTTLDISHSAGAVETNY